MPPGLLHALRMSLLATALFACSASAQTSANATALFSSDDLVEIAISGPIDVLKRERSDEEELDGTVSWTERDGRNVEVAVKLRARGNYRRRRDTCQFPPIRLNFKTSELDGTLFDGQDKVKLVTHCRDNSSRYQQPVLREWLTYRMFNLMTDLSYRVRLLRITYRDSDGKRDDHTAYGFVIEPKELLAERTGLSIVEIERTSLSDLAPEYTNLTSIFQLMIGNTDFSPLAGAEGETCCHNVNLFGGGDKPLYPVPYDFDMSGMIDAPYASPNPRFNLRSVKQRLYRGRCVNNAELPETIQTFQDKRDALYALVLNDQYMHARSRRSMQKYLDSFFKLIDNPKTIDRKIIRACVG